MKFSSCVLLLYRQTSLKNKTKFEKKFFKIWANYYYRMDYWMLIGLNLEVRITDRCKINKSSRITKVPLKTLEND